MLFTQAITWPGGFKEGSIHNILLAWRSDQVVVALGGRVVFDKESLRGSWLIGSGRQAGRGVCFGCGFDDSRRVSRQFVDFWLLITTTGRTCLRK